MKSAFAAALIGAAFIATPIAATLGFAALAPSVAHADAPATSTAPGATIDLAQAIALAGEQGVATVEEAELESGVWEVEGRDAEGRRIEVEIDAEGGALVRRELY